jgi:hypothetical protein
MIRTLFVILFPFISKDLNCLGNVENKAVGEKWVNILQNQKVPKIGIWTLILHWLDILFRSITFTLVSNLINETVILLVYIVTYQ